MVDGNSTRRPTVAQSRRRWLQTAAAASVAGLAGCSTGGGGGNGTTDAPSETSRPNVVDGTFRVAWTQTAIDLPTGQMNIWGQNFSGSLTGLIQSFSGNRSNTDDNRWYHLDLEGWDLDEENDEFRVRIRDDVYWTQSGKVIDPVTAEDWKVYEEVERYMVPEADRTADPAVVGWRVEGENDRVLVRELNPDGYNSQNLIANLARNYMMTYRNGFFGEKVTELKEASTTEAKNQVRQEISSKSLSLGQDPPLSGPYMLQDVNSQRATFTINPEHWTAKTGPATPRNFEIKVIGGGSNAEYQALQSGDIDLSKRGIPSSVPTDSVPDHVKQIGSESGASEGASIVLNYGGKIDPYVGVDGSKPAEERVAGPQQAKVRQAVAHAINVPDVLTNHLGQRAADILEPYPRAHPSPPARLEGHFPDLYEQLPSYTEADPAMAEQRLSEAGLSKNGSGTWTKPDGEPLTLTLQAFSTNVAMMQTVRDDLEAVGLQAELDTLGSTLWNQYLEGTFGVGREWVEGHKPLDIEARQKLTPGTGWPPTVKPGKYEIPPVGEMDADPTETVNVVEATSDFLTEGFDAHSQTVRKLVWTYAYHLPDVPLFPGPNSVTVNTNNLSWPDPVPEGTAAAATSDHHPVYGTTYLGINLSRSVPGVRVGEDQ